MSKTLLETNQYSLVPESDTPINTYLPPTSQVLALMDRLAKRVSLEEINQPTPTEQSCTYATITKPSQETRQPYQQPQAIVETTQVTTSTASSTLTNPQQQMTTLIKELMKSQQRQTNKMLAEQQTQIWTIISTQEAKLQQMFGQL